MRIDFHYHYPRTDGFVDKLLKEMDLSGVDKTLLMGGPEEAYWEYMNCSFAPNEDVCAAVKAHPDRLIGNVYLDPRLPDAIDTFEQYMAEGFRAVKMFPPVGFMPDDEQFFPLYEKIEQAGVPLLFHAGLTNIKVISKEPGVRKATNSKYSHPMNFDMISRLFPEMPIVMAHMGYPHYIEARSIAHANMNVYLDISGSGPWTEGIPVTFNALGGHQFIPLDFNRVLWGSDNCLTQAEHIARSDVYLRQMGASSKDRKLVFGETAQKLLGLS
jgi:predicted TIM-barrel fold metal-dependent hydrolase